MVVPLFSCRFSFQFHPVWSLANFENPDFNARDLQMKHVEDYQSIREFVDANREMLERVLRHSNNTYARACAWALIDAGSDAQDIAQLQKELDTLQDVAR